MNLSDSPDQMRAELLARAYEIIEYRAAKLDEDVDRRGKMSPAKEQQLNECHMWLDDFTQLENREAVDLVVILDKRRCA